MSRIGILAYGSLISDPGIELGPQIADRIPTSTPFPVEYGRYSNSRGGGPTVVPHSSGEPVRAEVLVLKETVSLGDAKDMLWRRETRNEGTRRNYVASSQPGRVLVSDKPGFHDLDHVLYTDFNESGKIPNPNPKQLANAAAIRIEGHTSSEWSNSVNDTDAFIQNMELSQERTRAVLNFSMDIQGLRNLNPWMRKTVSANGLSSARLVMKNNIEDKKRSRRVEFTIRTKTKEALFRILDKVAPAIEKKI